MVHVMISGNKFTTLYSCLAFLVRPGKVELNSTMNPELYDDLSVAAILYWKTWWWLKTGFTVVETRNKVYNYAPTKIDCSDKLL